MLPRGLQHDNERTVNGPNALSIFRSWSWFPNYSKEPKEKEQELTPDPDDTRKWIKGVLICSWIIGGVLVANIVLTVIAAGLAYSRNNEQSFSFASLYMGECSVSKNWTTGLHLVINILSTALLGASNYCMQCLAAPSRDQVDKAHSQKTWVRIGVPNIIDLLRYQTGKRRFLGLILLTTSLPIHLIYNSAVYFSIGPREYSIVAAHDTLISEHGNSTAFEQCFSENVGIDVSSFNKAIRERKFRTLSKQECVETFAQDYASGYGTLVLVTKDPMPKNESVSWVGTGNSGSFVGGNTQFDWLCNKQYPCSKDIAEDYVQNWSVNVTQWSSPTIRLSVPIPGGVYESGGWLDVGLYGVPKTEDYYHLDDILAKHRSLEELQAELDNSSGWVNGSFPGSVTVRAGEPDCTYPGSYADDPVRTYSIDHCMTLPAEETCQLFFSPPICLIVIGCTIVKLICTLLAAREDRDDIFLTTGDAIASFLASPDSATEGTCLLSSSLVNKKEQAWRKYKGKDLTSVDSPDIKQESPLLLPPRKRWFQATTTSRWICTMLLFVCILIPAGCVLRLGILNYSKVTKKSNIWNTGLGDASAATTLAGLEIPATASGIFSMIFMANIPQILVSLAYFFYNGLLTCMLSAVEYDDYAKERKPLRVSWPRGSQRSTYYLSLPYRYSIPLLIISAVLHWLVSQSLFFVQVIPFDRNGVAQTSYPKALVTCGYSPVSIIFAMILGGLLPIVAILLGLRRFRSHMPLSGQCSAAISAACHPMTTEVDHGLKPVKWGELTDHRILPGGFSNTITDTAGISGVQVGAGSHEQPQTPTTGLSVVSTAGTGFCHCTFTSDDVIEPSRSRLYI